MKRLTKVRQDLLNEEIALYDLDNRMNKFGYISKANNDAWDIYLKHGNIVYTEIQDNANPSIKVCFSVVIPVFHKKYTVIKITKVEEF